MSAVKQSEAPSFLLDPIHVGAGWGQVLHIPTSRHWARASTNHLLVILAVIVILIHIHLPSGPLWFVGDGRWVRCRGMLHSLSLIGTGAILLGPIVEEVLHWRRALGHRW